MLSEGILTRRCFRRINLQSCKLVPVKSAEIRPSNAVLDAKRSGTALKSVSTKCVICFIDALLHYLIFVFSRTGKCINELV